MNPVNITVEYLTHYSSFGAPDHMYESGRYGADIYGGKYRAEGLTFDELKDFVSFFVSDEHYVQIFGVEE